MYLSCIVSKILWVIQAAGRTPGHSIIYCACTASCGKNHCRILYAVRTKKYRRVTAHVEQPHNDVYCQHRSQELKPMLPALVLIIAIRAEFFVLPMLFSFIFFNGPLGELNVLNW